MKKFFFSALLVACGTIFGFVLRGLLTPQEANPSLATVEGDVGDLNTEIGADTSRLRVVELEARLAELELERATRIDEPPLREAGSTFSQTIAPASEEEMVERMQPVFGRMVEHHLDRYQGRLRLSPEQRQALSDVLLLQHETRHREMMRQARAGESQSEAAFDALDQVTDRDVMDLASDILNPEQFSEFQRIRTEEAEAAHDLVATARLNQMAPMLDLSEEQKNAVYSVFYTESEGRALSGGGPIFRAADNDTAREAIESVLTPEQLEIYRQYLAQEESRPRSGVSFPR